MDDQDDSLYEMQKTINLYCFWFYELVSDMFDIYDDVNINSHLASESGQHWFK